LKKLFGILFAAILALTAAIPASAGNGPVGACGTTVWTDATNYSTSATTVDFKASKGSSCGTVYYKARVEQLYNGRAYAVGSSGPTGYFQTATPIKKINIDWIKGAMPYNVSGPESIRLKVLLYSDSAMSNYIGVAYSHTLYIY
jgi:hypothetical protein